MSLCTATTPDAKSAAEEKSLHSGAAGPKMVTSCGVTVKAMAKPDPIKQFQDLLQEGKQVAQHALAERQMAKSRQRELDNVGAGLYARHGGHPPDCRCNICVELVRRLEIQEMMYKKYGQVARYKAKLAAPSYWLF